MNTDNVHRYLAVPFWVIEHPELTQAEHYVYAYVLGFDNAKKQCFAGVSHLASALKLSERSIIRARLKLKQLNLLVRRQDMKTGRVYHTTLIDLPDCLHTGADEDAIEAERQDCQNVTQVTKCHPRGDKMSCEGDKMSPPTGQNVTHIRSDIRSDINLERRESSIPPLLNSPEWYLMKASEALEEPNGQGQWESNNQFILAGRRPMKRYPHLWFTTSELAKAVEVVRDSLPPDSDWKAVFDLAESEATNQLVKRGRESANCYKYVTGYCLQTVLDTMTKTTYLSNSLRRAK